MAYCAQIKALGYKVFSQLVSVTTYSDDDLVQMCRVVNEVEPYAVSMVDTYGLLEPDTLKHIHSVIDDNLKPGNQYRFSRSQQLPARVRQWTCLYFKARA